MCECNSNVYVFIFSFKTYKYNISKIKWVEEVLWIAYDVYEEISLYSINLSNNDIDIDVEIPY